MRDADELVALAEEKSPVMEGCWNVGARLASWPDRRAADAVQTITSGIDRVAVNGSNMSCRRGYHIWQQPMPNSANSMTLGAALVKP